MEYKVKVMTIHEVGKRTDSNGKPHQEDSIYPVSISPDGTERLFILCDGMGGHAAGEVASQTVCETMGRVITESKEPFDDEVLLQALAKAYDKLDQIDVDSIGTHKMGTTLTLLCLHDAGATIAHIGDSRVYHIRPNDAHKDEVLFRTRDHSLVNDLIKIGSITPEEAKHHPQKNVITRAIQPHQDKRSMPDIYHTEDVRVGDFFFLCSDGMLEEMEDRNLCNILGDTVDDEAKINMLRLATKSNNDNHSAIMVRVVELSGAPASVKPKTSAEEQPVLPKTATARQASQPKPPTSDTQNGKPKGSDAQKKSPRRMSWIMVFLISVVVALLVALFAAKC